MLCDHTLTLRNGSSHIPTHSGILWSQPHHSPGSHNHESTFSYLCTRTISHTHIWTHMGGCHTWSHIYAFQTFYTKFHPCSRDEVHTLSLFYCSFSPESHSDPVDAGPTLSEENRGKPRFHRVPYHHEHCNWLRSFYQIHDQHLTPSTTDMFAGTLGS